MTEMTNSDRATRIISCIAEEYELDDGFDTTVCDVLTDLRHFCNLENVDFEGRLEMSEIHFTAEIADQPNESK